MELPNAVFQPDELTLFRTVLDLTTASIPLPYRTSEVKARLAERILRRAAEGERDPVKLKTAALLDFDFHPPRFIECQSARGR